MAASQYPATATPAGDRMTEPMIAMGTHRRPETGCPRPGWRLPGRSWIRWTRSRWAASRRRPRWRGGGSR